MTSTTPPAAPGEGAPRLRVVDARYTKSGSTCDDLGPVTALEIAFVGRSNVGKSSLLNTLTKTAHLVRTSRTPGQTRHVNLFAVTLGRVGRAGDVSERRDFTFADLPGYGFAKASKQEQQRLSRLLSHYLAERQGLRAVVHLFDARHGALENDVDVFREIATLDVEHFLVATKADKLRGAQRKSARAGVAKPLGISPESVLLFSSETGLGRDTLLARIWDLARPPA